jgi:hypothetical protein
MFAYTLGAVVPLLRATAAESQKKLEVAESESRRNRDEVETQRRSASDAQEALDGAFRMFASLEDTW